MKSNPVLAAVLILALALPLAGDEGMWLFNAPPAAQVKARYGFEITRPWLDHLRLSSLRFDRGGSGAFVSASGLVLTSYRVAFDCLHALSTAGHDYESAGFYARRRSQERRCPGMELDRLLAMSDVTAQVNAAVSPGMSDSDGARAQRAVIARIEAGCLTAAGLRCQVVALYSGARYELYRYRRYTDLRLVFAPEFQMAFFAGDRDNLQYPSYDLDVAFFRVYDNRKPLPLRNYLHWSPAGAKPGDLVFVSGSPAATGRALTLNHLEFLRAVRFPFLLAALQQRIAALQRFAAASPANVRMAQRDLFRFRSRYQAAAGYLAALNDPGLMNRRKGEERQMLVMSQRTPRGREVIPAMREIDRALVAWRRIWIPLSYLENRFGLAGELARDARLLVRSAAERQLPNGERLPEYRESALAELEQNLLSTAPIYKSLERARLEDSLSALAQQMAGDPAVEKTLNGRSPREAADQAIRQTHLDDPGARRRLYQGGAKAIAASADPLIVMMREIEPEALELRRQYDLEVAFVLRRAYARLARFRLAMGGLSAPPNPTCTLRLSFGLVKAYEEDGRGVAPQGTPLPAFTDIGGAFAHAPGHGHQPPYELPASWIKNRAQLDLKTPLNFVSTADVIGPSSGSPVVNRQGELVGVVSHGNTQSLAWNFLYDDRSGRAVSVDSRAILEALRQIYHAGALADELQGR